MTIEEIVVEELQKKTSEKVSLDSKIKEDLGIDSFKALSLLVILDGKGIGFKDGKLDDINTVKDLIESLVFKKWEI